MDTLIFLFVLLALFAMSALPPLLESKKRHGLYAIADIGLLILPSICLLTGITTLNSPAKTGWAFLVYPVTCSIICMLILYVRFFIIERFFPSKPAISVVVLAIACALAFFFGAIAAPLYE